MVGLKCNLFILLSKILLYEYKLIVNLQSCQLVLICQENIVNQMLLVCFVNLLLVYLFFHWFTMLYTIFCFEIVNVVRNNTIIEGECLQFTW